MAEEDVQHLSNVEHYKLSQKLRTELSKDILRIFKESLFCDLQLVLDDISIFVNRCLLQVRAARFYGELCSVERICSPSCELEISFIESITSFVKDIYSKEDISASEALVVSELQKSLKHLETEKFVTANNSPSDTLPSQVENCPKRFISQYGPVVNLSVFEKFGKSFLEQELAEQDFLSKSFKTIFQREAKKAKEKSTKYIAPRTYISKKQRLDRKLLYNLRKAVEEDYLLLEDPFGAEGSNINVEDKLAALRRLIGVENSAKNQLRTKLIFFSCKNLEEKEYESQRCLFYDAEDDFNCKELNFAMESNTEDKIRSVHISEMDAGPDSGLAISNPDMTNSQTSEEITEEMPHDHKSSLTPLSSDGALTDSPVVKPTARTLMSWVQRAPNAESTEDNAAFVDRVLEELTEKSRFMKDTDCNRDKTDQNEDKLSGDAAHSSKKNFFINAASLFDETETDSVYPVQPNFDVEVPETLILEHRNTGNGSNRTAEDSDVGLQDSATFDQTDTAQEDVKPPPLIRSDTFELGTEDGRLALLRQQYERRQGNMIFQTCLMQSSGPLSDLSLDHDQNQHYTSLTNTSLDIVNLVANPLLSSHVVEEDIQSPDSLNNDGLDELFEEKLHLNSAEDANMSHTSRGKMDKVQETDCTERCKIKTQDNSNRLESLPIISGGATIRDVPAPTKEINSPLFSRRKNDCAPILSGAAPPLSPEPAVQRERPKPPAVASLLSSAWVVDISDMTKSPESQRKKRRDSETSDNSTQSHPLSKSGSRSSSGLGFFIDLKDPKSSQEDNKNRSLCQEKVKMDRQLSGSSKEEKHNSCEFFVNLSESENPERRHSLGAQKVKHSPEQKLFSMFIDIGEQAAPKPKPEFASRARAPNSPFSSQRKIPFLSSSSYSGSSGAHDDGKEIAPRNLITFRDTCQPKQQQNNEAKKQSFYMFIESDSPLGKRKVLTSSLRPPSNRHALSADKPEKISSRNRHQRTQSLSFGKRTATPETDGSINSSMSRTSRQLSSQSLFSSESSDSSFKPMHSSCHASLPTEPESSDFSPKANSSTCNSRANLNGTETTCDDKSESSACSVDTYSIHTPSNSTATEDFSRSRQKSIENKKECRDKLNSRRNVSYQSVGEKEKMKREVEREKVSRREESSFVRLSDLDKEPSKTQEDLPKLAVQRMTRSIPETSWIESKLLMTRSTGGGTGLPRSSRSLSRLFPHLSTSGGSLGRSKTSSTCSPGNEDFDAMRSSEISDVSSMQSSVGLEYSTESTDLSSGRGEPTNQLGDDLLKMFLEEINPDVIVEVRGRRIKAHKCILSSRCQYFAAILSGGWVESAGNVISLQGFSYNSVHFALCHIYSGASTIPDQISIVELATLADMLCLEGLKEVIMYTLKVKYCHFFHKPCAVCSVGVLECLPLAAAYGLDDIYRKSLRWITKYFVRIWPTRAFTALPRELTDKCYQQIVVHMTEDNVLETVMCCDKLLATIPTTRWAEPVFTLTSRLLESCIKFMADNFSAVLNTESFLSLGREVPWNVSRLQDSLISATERLPPDQSCRSYARLYSILTVAQASNPPPEMTWHSNFVDLLVRLRDRTEQTLLRQAPRAARTPGWGMMPTELRRKIQDTACLVLTPPEQIRYRRGASENSACGSRSSYSRSLDLRQVKMAMVQHAKRTMAGNPENRQPAPVPVKSQQTVISRRSAPVGGSSSKSKEPPAEGKSSAAGQSRPKTWPAQVKSRYLEVHPKPSKQAEQSNRNPPTAAPIPQRKVNTSVKGIFISSSDSSRNSSPAMKRSGNVLSNGKTSDSSTRSRAATVGEASNSLKTTNHKKDEEISRSTSNLTKSSNKNKMPYTSKKSDNNSIQRKDNISAGPVAKLGTQSIEVTMSSDSLATESSYNEETRTLDDLDHHNNRSHSIDNTKVCQKSASRFHKRAVPLTSQKSTASTINAASPLPKRSISHAGKSPNILNPSSRLAIPLRTSRSSSSVPERLMNRSANNLETKTPVKAFNRSQVPTDSGRDLANGFRRTPGAKTSNSSMAGKASISKSNRVNNNVTKGVSNVQNRSTTQENNPVENIRPTVGPRSGTFLKDEPTVIKSPQVDVSDR